MVQVYIRQLLPISPCHQLYYPEFSCLYRSNDNSQPSQQRIQQHNNTNQQRIHQKLHRQNQSRQTPSHRSQEDQEHSDAQDRDSSGDGGEQLNQDSRQQESNLKSKISLALLDWYGDFEGGCGDEVDGALGGAAWSEGFDGRSGGLKGGGYGGEGGTDFGYSGGFADDVKGGEASDGGVCGGLA